MKKAFKIIRNVSYYILIGFLLIVILISSFSSGGIIKTLGFGWYRVVSGSMEPVIMTNDYIIANKLDDINKLEVGDIIIFEAKLYPSSKEKSVITHHFGGFDESGNVLTYPHKEHGKEHIRYDSWQVKPENVIGVHSFTLHVSGFVGFIIFIFTNPIGLIILISTVVSIFYVYRTYKNKKNILKEENNNDSNLE